MNKNGVIISMLSVITIIVFFSKINTDEKNTNEVQNNLIKKTTEANIEDKEQIIKNIDKKVITNIHKKIENIQEENIQESYDIKTIYSIQTVGREYEILLTSEKNISSKPIGIKYDSGVVVNESIIIYGKIDNNISYRMLFGKEIVDNVNDITFVLKNNKSNNIDSLAPTFLYLIDKAGQYKMNIKTSPLFFSALEYIEPKHNMKNIIENIQLRIKKGHDEIVPFNTLQDTAKVFNK